MPTQQEWQTAGRLIDTNGWFSIRFEEPTDRKSPRWHYRIGYSSTMRQTCEWLAETFGGRVSEQHKKNEAQGYSKCLTWRVPGHNRLAFVKGILPHLIVKTLQAELLLAMWEGIDPDRARVRVSPEEHQRRVAIVRVFRAIKTRKQKCKPLP